MDETYGLNNQEIGDAVALLARLEPGFLPKEIFFQVARLCALPIVEMVPLRISSRGGIEVLLVRRSIDDPFWPNLWHNPGTVVRAKDTLVAAFDRLTNGELGGATLLGDPVFVEALFNSTERGYDVAQVYWVELATHTDIGAYFPVDSLPPDTVKLSEDVIRVAARAYVLAKGVKPEGTLERMVPTRREKLYNIPCTKRSAE